LALARRQLPGQEAKNRAQARRLELEEQELEALPAVAAVAARAGQALRQAFARRLPVGLRSAP